MTTYIIEVEPLKNFPKQTILIKANSVEEAEKKVLAHAKDCESIEIYDTITIGSYLEVKNELKKVLTK